MKKDETPWVGGFIKSPPTKKISSKFKSLANPPLIPNLAQVINKKGVKKTFRLDDKNENVVWVSTNKK